MNEIKAYINMPFHGESAYDIAVRHGYGGTESEWLAAIGKIGDADLKAVVQSLSKRLFGYIWYLDTDAVADKSGAQYGTLAGCMTDEYAGSWFYAVTTTSTAGEAVYPEKYVIDGANGHLSLRDYVIWTGSRLVHVPTFEAKSSTEKNSDGKYSPKSGVDGLMSSTDKAYLTDLINAFWGKEKLPVYAEPDPKEGWQTNWLFNTGWYLGGIKKNCGGHPPVVKDNHTSWAVLVLNGMATDADSLNHNHRLQMAFDVVNSKIYMRRGWMSTNEWAEGWNEIGAITGGSITEDKLSESVKKKLDGNAYNSTLVITEASGSYAVEGYKNVVVSLAAAPSSSDYIRLMLPSNPNVNTTLSFNLFIYYPPTTDANFEVKITAPDTIARCSTHVYNGSTYVTCIYCDSYEWIAHTVTLN